MAWVTPPTVSTGDVVTATQWNQIAGDLNETAPGKVTTKGDIVAATGANALSRVAAGVNGTRLAADSSQSAGVKWETPQYCRLHRASTQSIGTGADTAIQFAASTGPGSGTPEEIDPSDLHSTSTNNTRITIGVAGKYLIGGEVTFAANTAGTQRYVTLAVNGNVVARQRFAAAPATGVTPQINVSTLYALAVGDYVEVRCYQDIGSALNCTDAVLWVALVGAY
jgi:hypothetical protein